MSAPAETSRLNNQVQKLGIIAGGGMLPAALVHACEQKGIEPYIIGIEGQVDTQLLPGRKHAVYRLGLAGKMVEDLKNNNVQDIVLIGSVKRPSLSSLRPDLRTAGFFARLGLRALGDNDLLQSVKEELEAEGFSVHGVQDFVEGLLAPSGILGKHKPSKQDEADIELGIKITQAMGRLDVGQSAVVMAGVVLGVEAAEGTDALIRRCTALKGGERGGVLIKTCKPQQDKALDLPTVGPDTVALCVQAGFSGIAVQAGQTILIDKEEIKKMVNANKMFFLGVDYP